VNLCPGVGPFGVWGEVDAELIRARIIAACEMTREREREREREQRSLMAHETGSYISQSVACSCYYLYSQLQTRLEGSLQHDFGNDDAFHLDCTKHLAHIWSLVTLEHTRAETS